MNENAAMENLPKAEVPIETESRVPAEKIIPQSVVDDVKQAKYQAYEQGKKAAKEELAQQPVNPPVSTQASAPLTTEDVQNLIVSHNAQQANEWQAQQIAQQFLGKLTASKDKYPDFGESLTSFDLPTSLKTSFKLKTVADGTDMKEIIVRLIQAYVDEKINLDEI